MISTAGPLHAGNPDQDIEKLQPDISSEQRGVPLSWEQEQIWVHAMQSPELPLYTETLTILYRGELDITAFEHALLDLCRRHEILRSVIEEQDGVARCVVKAAKPVHVEYVDAATQPEEVREERVRELLSGFSTQPFVLDRGPLLRALAVRYGSDDMRIFLTLHHLLFDGASLRQILLPDLIALYEDHTTHTPSRLEPPKMQYADYVRWQQTNGPTAKEAAMGFWRGKLANLSPFSLPADRPPSPHTSRRGAVQFFSFEKDLTEAVLTTARQQRTTAFSVLLASFLLLLARYSETEDVALGTVYGGRASTELESVMGCFLNILLLHTDLSGDPSFSELLTRVRGVTLDALENAAAPFHEVVRQVLPRTGAGSSPIQALFSFQPPSSALPPEWDLDVFGVFNGCAKFDLHLEIEQRHGVFRGRLMYSSDLFDAATIEKMLQHWLHLLRAAIGEPAKSVWKLAMLSSGEQDWLVHGLNPEEVAVPQLCAHELFAQNAAQAPERIAVRCKGETLSYLQLDRWSADVAVHLRELGLGAGSVIALMMDRSPDMLAGLLGILRSGAAYVPLDPTYPPARLEHMLRASEATLLLTQSYLLSGVPEFHPSILDIAECRTNFAAEQAAHPRIELPHVDLASSAYILFTSGSTGLPKGVEVPHSALTNLLVSMRETPGITADDGLLAVTSISFDIAALEIFLPLIAGARVELATAEEAADPALLAARMVESGATVMQATPATWRMLMDYGWPPVQSIKILCGGEAFPPSLAEQLLRHSSSVWNMYGPTETTIWSACVQLQPGASEIFLGAPVMNTGLYVLDAHQMLAPAGVSGELYISGAGLAKGYYGQPELTRERFPTVSFTGEESIRLYRTGDRVKRTREGSLQFLGRTDKQIKLHGFRIELGEIEQVLNAQPGVRQSAVVLADHPSRGKILAGYVVPKAGAALQTEELRTGLAMQLPKSMLPSVLRILDEVPLTLNGKLDRSRLPGFEVEEESAAFEPPHSGIEQTLASIWCDVLGLKTVGRRDNFFELGGHSLEAVRYLSLANRALDRKMTFASFIQGPTIAQLSRLAQEGEVPRVQLLKQGSAGGKRLLWIGAEPWLTRFARHLTDDITFYTITPDVGPLGADTPACTIEALAGQIVANVRELKGEGPYLLGGFCLRSLLAFEIAHRLEAEGEDVALLILGDLYAPGQRPQWNAVQRILRRIHRESCNLFSVLSLPFAKGSRELRHLFTSWRRLLMESSADTETPDELLQALYEAELRYNLAPFPGKVLFLESAESRLLGGSTARTWMRSLGNIEVLRYPGIHENLFKEPHLGAFALKIEDAMERASSPAARPQGAVSHD